MRKTWQQRLWRRAQRMRVTRAHLPWIALVSAIVAATWLTLPRTAPPAPATTRTAVVIGGPFALIGPGGAPITDKSFPGKYLLIFFGYTYCPDVCPTTLTSVAGALDQLGPLAARVQPLFITVDPQRDTVDVLQAYVGHFDKRIIGLTGSPASIEAAEKAYRVYAAPSRTGDGPNDYLMDHSAVVYLMDPQGTFVTVLDHASPAEQMAKDLKSVLTQDKAG